MHGIVRMICAVTACVLCAAVSLPAYDGTGTSEEFTRMHKQDIYLLSQAINGKTFDFKTQSGVVPLSMDTAILGGIGFGYHFSEVAAVRFEMIFGNTSFRGVGVAAGSSRAVAMNQGMINVDWLPVRRSVSPFLTAGAGVQYIEAQLSTTGVPVAYWDPWWGYTNTVAYSTHSETNFVWQLGAGLRWDVTRSFFLRVSVDSSWINYVNISGLTNQVKYGLAVGASY